MHRREAVLARPRPPSATEGNNPMTLHNNNRMQEVWLDK
jgi:hypothetical protein